MLPARINRLLIKAAAIRLLLPQYLRLPLALWRYRRYFAEGIRSLWQGKLGVPVLDALAIGVGIATRSYGAANSIMLLLKISDILQQRTLRKTRKALRRSLSQRIERVWLRRADGVEISTPLREIHPGDCIVVRTGGMVPVDGEVLDGRAEVNEAQMTGESAETTKQAGSRVFAGTSIQCGRLLIRVISVDEKTRINKLIALAEQADALKAHVQTDCEHLADHIVPWSLLAAGLTWALSGRIGRASSVLMVDYSCALKLTTPIVMATVMRQAVKHGVMVKGGKYLEAVAEADTVVFDKTGTLTTATPHVSRILALPPRSEDDVLQLVAGIEEHFHHSKAHAIMAEARRRHLHPSQEKHGEVELVVGRGIRSSIDGYQILVGCERFLFEDEGIPRNAELESQLERGGCESTIWLAVGGQAVGVICLQDTLRPEAADVIRSLKTQGIQRVIMLTGDIQSAADSAATELGITEYYAALQPEQKADIVCKLREEGRKVILVGDGVNDSTAMTCAQVAVSMKDAADLAREISDITLLENNLKALVALRQLAVAAMRRIHSNYRFIAGFNSALILLGAFGVLPPLLSAWLHNLSTVGTCMSSARRFSETD